MTLPALEVSSVPDEVPASTYRIVDGDGPEVLARIAEPSVGLALWRRRLPQALVTWLAQLPPRRLPEGRVLVRLDDLGEAVASLLAASRTPQAPASTLLAADVIDLARRFARSADSDTVDLRLEIVRHHACWKFHRDCVRLRLLTTYLGPTTQIVTAGNADRALQQQRAYRGPLRPMPTDAVALFKGAEARPGTGVVHRSPPVAGTGQHRLVLCVNLPSLASPDPWPGPRPDAGPVRAGRPGTPGNRLDRSRATVP
jgi:hypothetical protein